MAPIVGALISSVGLPLAMMLIGKIGNTISQRALQKQLGQFGMGTHLGPNGTVIVPQFTKAGRPSKLGPVVKPFTPNYGVGKGMSAVGNVAGHVLPHILSTLGKGVAAGGATAGAAAKAAGAMPHALAQVGNSDRKREIYGATPMDAAGIIGHNVGDAANVGANAFGNAIGSSLNDVGYQMRQGQHIKDAMNSVNDMGMLIKELGLTGGEAAIIQRLISMQGLGMHGMGGYGI